MSYCDSVISASIGTTCAAPKKGYERKAVIINRSDIDFDKVTRSASAGNVVTALPLLDGKSGYAVVQSGNTPFTGSGIEGVTGTYANTVNKTVVFAILENDREVFDKFLDPALNGEFVMILEKKDKGTDNKSAFVIVGLDQGARMSALSGDPYGDTAGGVLLTLVEENAPNAALYLGETYSAAKTVFDSLAGE